jgi:O-antigen ligase
MRRISLWLSLGLIFSIPWENAISFEEIGTLTRGIGIAAFVSWAISIVIDRHFRSLQVFHCISFFYIYWNILSFYWSIGINESVNQILTLIQLGAMAWMLIDLYSTSEKLRLALEAYILGAYITIFSSIGNFVEDKAISTYEQGRFTGAGINAVELTIILSIALVCSWYLATTSDGNTIFKKLLIIANFCFCPLAVLCILLTGSRTAVFSLAPALLFIAFSVVNLKFVYKAIIAACTVAILLFIISLIPDDTAERLLSIGESVNNYDMGGRGELWHKSTAIFLEHPIIGVGCGALRNEELLGEVAHNTFLSVMAELGLIGFSIFVAMLAVVGHKAVLELKRRIGIWFIVLAIWTIGCMSLSWELTKTTWLIMSIIIACERLGDSKESKIAIEQIVALKG